MIAGDSVASTNRSRHAYENAGVSTSLLYTLHHSIICISIAISTLHETVRAHCCFARTTSVGVLFVLGVFHAGTEGDVR